MKIIHWATFFLPHIGGLETLVNVLAQQLMSNGHEVEIICNCCPEDLTISSKKINNITVHKLPFKESLLKMDLKLVQNLLQKAKQILQTFNPDVVHIHGMDEVGAFYQERLIRQLNLPCILTIHGLVGQPDYLVPACGRLWPLVSRVNVVSRFLQRKMLAKNLLHQHPIELIYNAILPYPQPLQPLSLDPMHLVMIGRLTEEKGFADMFHAMAILIKKHPQLHLTMVGHGSLEVYLRSLREQLGLTKHITMVGRVESDQVYRYYDQASLVIFPSYQEAFGLVCLEAAARGRAVLASRSGGLPEVVQEDASGCFYEAGSITALATVVDDLIQHPEKIHVLSQQARQAAETVFNSAKMAKQYLQLYQISIEEKNVEPVA